MPNTVRAAAEGMPLMDAATLLLHGHSPHSRSAGFWLRPHQQREPPLRQNADVLASTGFAES